MTKLFFVALGGAAGTVARYLVSSWAAKRLGTSFPWGTLMVNVVGSFFLAVLMQLSATAARLPATVHFALTVGVLGGFTTYSTFSYEAFHYFDRGAWPFALGYGLATVIGCFLACALGALAVRAWLGT